MDENLPSALRVAKFNPCIRYEVPQLRQSDFDTQLDQSRRLRSFALISLAALIATRKPSRVAADRRSKHATGSAN